MCVMLYSFRRLVDCRRVALPELLRCLHTSVEDLYAEIRDSIEDSCATSDTPLDVHELARIFELYMDVSEWDVGSLARRVATTTQEPPTIHARTRTVLPLTVIPMCPEGVAWAARSSTGPRVLPVGPGVAPNLQARKERRVLPVVTGTTGRTSCGTPERFRYHLPQQATAHRISRTIFHLPQRLRAMTRQIA